MERKLVSVQKVSAINPIVGADNIECATVLGWHLVVKKGEFKPGDLGIYFEIDSVLPERPEFEFLRKSSWSSSANGFRIKTVKLRGQISQGILFPMKPPLSEIVDECALSGKDLAEALGVKKWEDPRAHMGGEVKGSFPSFIPKTDEIRIQSVPGFLERHQGEHFYVTEKLDGTSATYYLYEGKFGVCSRNLELKETEDNVYWQMARKYDIENKLKVLGDGIAVQGEIIGPGIQGNKYKLQERKLYVFGFFDINNQSHFTITKPLMESMAEFVPLMHYPFSLPSGPDAVDLLIEEIAVGPSLLNKDVKREGAVVRCCIERGVSDYETGRLSFKVINPHFLLEHKE